MRCRSREWVVLPSADCCRFPAKRQLLYSTDGLEVILNRERTFPGTTELGTDAHATSYQVSVRDRGDWIPQVPTTLAGPPSGVLDKITVIALHRSGGAAPPAVSPLVSVIVGSNRADGALTGEVSRCEFIARCGGPRPDPTCPATRPEAELWRREPDRAGRWSCGLRFQLEAPPEGSGLPAGVPRGSASSNTVGDWHKGVLVKMYKDFAGEYYIGSVCYVHLVNRVPDGHHGGNTFKIGTLPPKMTCNVDNCDCLCTGKMCCYNGVHCHMQAKDDTPTGTTRTVYASVTNGVRVINRGTPIYKWEY